MTSTQDVKTLLGSLLRVNQAEATSEVDRNDQPQDGFFEDSPLSQSELYRDENGNLLPSKLHVVPLFGRPVLPSQITTVQLHLEWIDVISEVIASPHHTFAMFSVPEDKLKKRKISLKDFPKTGTVVRLLSARTGPDEIDIICEGIRRVSLLDVADTQQNLASVRYPEIEYRLANPTLRDKLNSNAQALRQSLERTSEFEKKFKKLRFELEQYARSIGVRVAFSPRQPEAEFYLINNPHQVGRISLGKLNTLLDFVNVKLEDEQKMQLAMALARPDAQEYARLKKYISQLQQMHNKHRESLNRDLERISPQTKAIADSFIEMMQAKRSNGKVVEAKLEQDEAKAVEQDKSADNKAESGEITLVQSENVQLEPEAKQEAVITPIQVSAQLIDAQTEEPLAAVSSPIYMSSGASLEETIAAAMQQLTGVKSLDPKPSSEALAEIARKSAYKSRLNQESSTSLDENMLSKLKLSDESYASTENEQEAVTGFDMESFLDKISKLIQNTSDGSVTHSQNFKLSSMGSQDFMATVSALEQQSVKDEQDASEKAQVKSEQDDADNTQAKSELDAQTKSELDDADNAQAKSGLDAQANSEQDNSESDQAKLLATKAQDKKDLFDLFSLLNEVGAREEQALQSEKDQFTQKTIERIIESAPKDESNTENLEPVLGPNFGFVNEDTSVVTFLPGQDTSEDLLLKLTKLQKEQEQQLKDEAAAVRVSKIASDTLQDLKDKQSTPKADKSEQAESKVEDKQSTQEESPLSSSNITSVIDGDEITTQIIADANLSEKDLAREISSLFSILGDDKDGSSASSSKWAHLQRATMIREKIASLLGGKVVFGVSTLNEKQKGAQREVESRAYCLGITAALQELLPLNPLITEEMQQYLSRSDMSNPSVLADCAASVTQSKPSELQQVLDTIPILPRLKLVFELISRELSAAKLQDKIKMSVAEKIQKRQKEFFLKEQLNEIKTELGLTADEKDLDVKKFRERMKKLSPPTHIKERFEEEISKLSVLEPASPEYGVTRNYLDIITSVPWGKMSKEKFNLDRARKILDQDHEGLQDVKDRIIEFMAVGALKGQTRGQIMLFVGPPGVGKTSIGKSIAKALNRPFFRLSLGGMDDVSEIKGHRKTYVGAMPGKLVNALRETKVMNPVIMLDEIDKLGRSYHGDPDSALLETLDPEQNKNFLDVYLDEKLDLSNCLFICTANSTETISGPLLDRMDPIQLSGYIAREKFAIAKKHLIPRAFEDAGIKDKRTLQIPDDTLNTLIEGYARESGVRSLERAIAKLIRKSAVKLVEGKSRILIQPNDLEDYLGTAPFKKEKMLQGVGIMTGLAWTASGGVTLPVESIVTSQDTAGFKLTGSLGDVMKESANIALSFVQSHLSQYCAKKGEQFFKKKTVHLHVPEGAIPKDGPSAGITMATSLLSLALNQAPCNGFAMTGELTLTGHVLPIGGLREKVIAARRMGIFDLIIPIGNEGDVKELPEQVKTDVTFYYADTYADVAYVLFEDVKQRLDEQGYKAPRSYKFDPATESKEAKEAQQAKEQAESKKAVTSKSKAKTQAKAKARAKSKATDSKPEPSGDKSTLSQDKDSVAKDKVTVAKDNEPSTTQSKAKAVTSVKATTVSKDELQDESTGSTQTQAKTSSQTKAKTSNQSKAKTSAKVESKVEGKAETKGEDKAESKAKAPAKASSKTSAQSKAKTESKGSTQAQANNSSQTKAKTSTKVESEVEAKTESTESKVEDKAETKTESKAKAPAKTTSKISAQSQAKTSAKTESKSANQSKTKAQANAPKAAPAQDSKAPAPESLAQTASTKAATKNKKVAKAKDEPNTDSTQSEKETKAPAKTSRSRKK